jgi:hypothetical protein
MRFYHLVMGCFSLMMVCGAPLHAMDCDGDHHFNPRSVFHVVTHPVQVLHFHNYTTHQIEQMRNVKFHNNLVHSPGVTLAEHEFKMDYQIGGLEHHNGDGFCVWVDSVDVSFSYSQMNVYVSSQYPEGSCPYRVILNHENQHVSIDQRVLAKYRTRIEWALKKSRSIPTKAHPLSVVSMNNGKAIIAAKLNQIVDPILQAYKNEIARENGKLDTPANYRRTQALCNNW